MTVVWTPSPPAEELEDAVDVGKTDGESDITYSCDKSQLDLQQVRELWCVALGRVCTPASVERAIQHSFTIQAAYVQKGGERRLIGLSRCLSDCVFAALFADVCVDPRYRQRGIGTELVRSLCVQTKARGPQGFAAFPDETNWRFLLHCGFRWNARFTVMTYDP